MRVTSPVLWQTPSSKPANRRGKHRWLLVSWQAQSKQQCQPLKPLRKTGRVDTLFKLLSAFGLVLEPRDREANKGTVSGQAWDQSPGG